MSSKRTKKAMSKKPAKKATTAKAVAAATRPGTKNRARRSGASLGTDRSEASGESPQPAQSLGAPSLPPVGTVIQKKDRYGNVRCECRVEENGFRYEGVLYRSLSAAAMAAAMDLGLTNKTQNGWTFWGLTKPPRPTTDPLETLERGWARYHRSLTAVVKDGVTNENRAKVLTVLRTHTQAIEDVRGQVA